MGCSLLSRLLTFLVLCIGTQQSLAKPGTPECQPAFLPQYCTCPSSDFNALSCRTPNGSFLIQYFHRPEMVVLLDASDKHNDVVDIPDDFLQEIRKASRLRVMLQNISSLPEHLSGSIEESSWTVLEMTSPYLKSLPENLFTRTRLLDTVMLKGTHVEILPKKASCKVMNFIFVENQLLQIPPGFFDCCTYLRNVDLRNNLLSTLPDKVFHKNRRMETICLRNNKLKVLPASLFSKCLMLEEVDLTNNFITSLPEDLFPPTNAKLRFLFLQNNNLTQISDHTFSGLNSLEELDLSFNKLEVLPEGLLGSCPRLRLLNLEANSLRTISSSLIFNCSLLRVLNVRQNNLDSLPAELLEKCHHLSSLSLDYNNIRVLPDSLLNSCSQLRDLSVSDNQLHQVASDLLHHSSLLSTIIFAGNYIEALPHNFTVNLVHLEVLDLSRNHIQSVSAKLHFSDVNVCNLSSNALTVLTMNTFRWTGLRSTLDISHNFVFELSLGWAAGLEQLRILDLSYNKLTVVGARDLSLLTNVHTINLSHNEISYIESEAFQSCNYLQYLDVSANDLFGSVNELPPMPARLQLLNISGNRLTELPATWTSTVVDAHGNPLHLNSFLAYITDPLFKKNHLLINSEAYDCMWHSQLSTDFSELPSRCAKLTPCPLSCQCSKGVEEIVVDCRNAGLTAMPEVEQISPTALFLEGNKVKSTVAGLSKESWKNVQYLYLRRALDSSSLAAVEWLPNLLQLKVLDLSHNGLTHPLLPRISPALQRLNWSHNSLGDIPTGVFANASAVQVLDLSHNVIKSLNSDVFRGLDSLQELVLSGNLLTSWNKVWESLPVLKLLHLNNNALTDIPLDVFVGAMHLQFLDLHSNLLNLDRLFHQPASLVALDLCNTSFFGSFSDKDLSPNLTYIAMKHNKITDITVGSGTADNDTLLVIDLTENLVKHLHLEQQHGEKAKGFVDLFLGNNPLVCDCSLASFLPTAQQLTVERVTLHVEEGRCSLPSFLAGSLLTSLTADQLLCRSNDCPSWCYCYLAPNGGLIVDCSGLGNMTTIPNLKPQQFATELYLDNKGAVESLQGLSLPSWHNLSVLHLINCCQNMESLDTTVLNFLPNLQHLDLNEKCWCRLRDFVAANPSGIVGSCELSLPFPRCIRQPNTSLWKFVECSGTFEPPATLRVPACFVHEQCYQCTCYFDLYNYLVMNCSNQNLTALPNQAPPGVQILDMDGNGLQILQGLDLPQWQTLEELSMRNNDLVDVNDEKLPLGLKVVALERNRLQRPSGWLSRILNGEMTGTRVWLSQNAWSCDCRVLPTTELPDLSVVIADAKEAYCTQRESTEQELLADAILNCSKKAAFDAWVALIVGLSVSLGLIAVFAVIAALWFRYNKAVNLWLFEHHCCLLEEDLDDDEKDYDAFVAYSSADGLFVANHLLPGLELAEEPRFQYRLCIHERDWLGGDLITEQIVRSTERSRRTILVLTENFAASSWSILEFRTALQQALEDRINRLIVVVPGLVPEPDTLPPDLRLFVAMNTYLMFNDSKFWEKLRYAMPHRDRSFTPPAGQERRLPEDFVELMRTTSELAQGSTSNSEKSLINE